jgi:hypothetical protein
MPKVKTFLYAVRMLIPGVEIQPVKVGFSSCPSKRRLAYNSGPYPCEWLGVWPGTLQDELNFHIQFYELNQGMAGEWFTPNQEFMDEVNKKINKYRDYLERAAKRSAEFDLIRKQREAEQEIKDRESRIRAAQVLEDRYGDDALERVLGFRPARDYTH